MLIHCGLLMLMMLTHAGRVHATEIIGGREAVPHSRPYMALVEGHMKCGRIKRCGGFLLHEDFVMTAAHCQASSYTVLLGLHRYKEDAKIQSLSVKQAYPHKDFLYPDFKNDIMLLKLSSKANLTDHVRPIALADISDVCWPKSCLVSGWGATDNSRFMSLVLMEVNVTLTYHQQCVENNVYCSEGKAGPSNGDSGDPLVCEGKAYGVMSYSNTTLHYFTRIPDYRRWIVSVLDSL